MSERRSHPSWLGRLGLVLVLLGLGALGWVAWQVWGTDVVGTRTHRSIVEQVEDAWARAADEPVAPAVDSDHGTVSAIVRVPRFGEDYAVPVLEGTGDEELAAGFGRFTGGATVGARGNFALAGHRVTHGSPLRAMPELRAGDEVVVETARWTYTYVLDTAGDDLRVPFTATWVLDAVPRDPGGADLPAFRPGQRLLTLTTCAELFHTDDRLVAFGHLDSREPTAR